MMGRLLGLDYGKKRVGVAISDPLSMFASGYDTLPNQSAKKLIQALKEIMDEYQVELVVMGLPLRSTGEKGESAEAVEAFAQQLIEATGVTVVYEDERFTSVIAQQSLREQGVQPSKQKHLTDKTAAALILQQYLDKQARQ